MLLMPLGGCGGANNSSSPSNTTRQVPATYTLGAETITPGAILDNSVVVCSINATDISGAPETVRLSYSVIPTNAAATTLINTEPVEAALRNGRYRFFLTVPSRGEALTTFISTPTETVSLPIFFNPGVSGSGGATGIPIFITNSSGDQITAAPSNTPVTLTVDASRVPGSPDVVSITYQGPLSGPAQATKSSGQYVIQATTGTATQNTSTAIVLAGNSRGSGPTVQSY